MAKKDKKLPRGRERRITSQECKRTRERFEIISYSKKGIKPIHKNTLTGIIKPRLKVMLMSIRSWSLVALAIMVGGLLLYFLINPRIEIIPTPVEKEIAYTLSPMKKPTNTANPSLVSFPGQDSTDHNLKIP